MSCFACARPMTWLGVSGAWWCGDCDVREKHDPAWISPVIFVKSHFDPVVGEIIYLDHSRGHYPHP